MSSHSNDDNLAKSLGRENDSAEFPNGSFTYHSNPTSLPGEYLATQWEQTFGTQCPLRSDEICGENPDDWTQGAFEPESHLLGGESSQPLPTRDSHEANPAKDNPQSDSDGDVPENPALRVIQYCSLESHATFLQSGSAPYMIGVNEKTLEDLMESITEYPKTYGTYPLLKKYSEWAAKQAGPRVEKEDICARCFWAHQEYYRKRTSEDVTCHCKKAFRTRPKPPGTKQLSLRDLNKREAELKASRAK